MCILLVLRHVASYPITLPDQVTCTSRVLRYLRSLTRRLGDKSNEESDLPKRVDQCYSWILDGASRSQLPESTEDADYLVPMTNDQKTKTLYRQGETKRFIRPLASLLPVKCDIGSISWGRLYVQMNLVLQNSDIFKPQREFSTSKKCNGLQKLYGSLLYETPSIRQKHPWEIMRFHECAG